MLVNVLNEYITLNKILIVLVVALISCNIDHDKAVDRNKFSFKTGDDTELFFKNVRQSYYDLEENKAAKLNVFRFENRVINENRPVINLAIVMNYLNDEAYILVEPNQMIGTDQLVLIEKSAKNDTIRLTAYNRDEMLEFCSKIYEGIQHKSFFEIVMNNTSIPILTDSQEREAFRITMSDYYRLTRIY